MSQPFTALHQDHRRIRSLFFYAAHTRTHFTVCCHTRTLTGGGLKTVLHSDAHFEEVNQQWVLFAIIRPYGLARMFSSCVTVTSRFKFSCLWLLLWDLLECAIVVAGRTAAWSGCSNFLWRVCVNMNWQSDVMALTIELACREALLKNVLFFLLRS
jgi:hypothetical protein